MAIAVDPRATFSYVLECDRELPQEQQTTWELRGLTALEEAKIADDLVRQGVADGEVRYSSGSRVLTILRYGLRGVRGFFDASGAEVPFEETKGHPRQVADAFLDKLQPAWRIELANAITERGRPSVQEGNS